MGEIARYVGRMLIPQLVGQGLIASAIIRELRSSGYSYRYQDMLKDVREEVSIATFGEGVKRLADNVKIPTTLMTEIELKLNRHYRVFGMAKYVNVGTGYTSYQPISFYDDTLCTKADWSKEFESRYNQSACGQRFRCEGVDIFAIEHMEGWRY